MSQKPAVETPRRPARDLIDAVVDHMRKNVEPLKYSTLVPSRYTVYLHPAEFARLEGIVPVLQEQTARALGEALESMNRRPHPVAISRWIELVLGKVLECNAKFGCNSATIESIQDHSLQRSDWFADSGAPYRSLQLPFLDVAHPRKQQSKWMCRRIIVDYLVRSIQLVR